MSKDKILESTRLYAHKLWHGLLLALRWVRQEARYHWGFSLVLTIFSVVLYIMMIIIPPGDKQHDPILTAPDETAHYAFNVLHIVNHNSLPVSGKDDIEAYQACTPNHVGLAPCVYSYTIYPGPSYLMSAFLVKVFHKLGDPIPSYNVSRITSVLSGIAFAIFSYAAVYSIIRRRSYATVLIASVLFIPQFIFTLSYTNLDAYSAGVSAFLGLAVIQFMLNPHNRHWQIALAVALFGLLPTTKYNYFALGLGALLLIWHTARRVTYTKMEIKRFAKYAAISFLLLASFWYLRNLILYHDLFGQSYMLKTMAHYSPLGTPYPVNLEGLNIAIQRDFFTTVFQSFFFALGLMHFYLSTSSYDMLLLILLGCVAIVLYNFTQPLRINTKRRKEFKLATLLFILVGVCTLLIVLVNSLVYDFQPQGRYMYPILVPTLLLVALAIRHDKRNGIVPYLMIAGTSYLFIAAIGVVVKAYMQITF